MKGLFTLIQGLGTFALLMFISASSYAAEIKVAVDRNPVAIHESFQLIFSTTAPPDGKPDFSPLEQDFDIENQQHRNQSSWDNGQSASIIQWELTLTAKKSGSITIPKIQFGRDASMPATILVSESTPLDDSESGDIFLKVDVSSRDTYVQAQTLYTVRLYQRVRVLEAGLSAPTNDNAVIESVSNSQFKTTINGDIYLVTERKYAIFPQKSGELHIPALNLTVRVTVNNNSYYGRSSTEVKQLTSKAITLNVRPIPNEFKSKQWLAAEDLTLHDSWSNEDITVDVGDSITRTVTLKATGIMPSQLPEFPKQTHVSQLKSYPDKAIDTEKKDGLGFATIREQKIAFIPSEPGTYTLAAIEIPWFNTKTNKQEVTRLPAVTLTAVAITSAIKSSANPINVEDQPKQPFVKSKSSSPLIWQALSFLFAVLWLATLYYLWETRVHNQKSNVINKAKSPKIKHLIKDIKEACQQNDPHQCQTAFIAWAKYQLHTTDMKKIRAQCNQELHNELNQLQAHLYSKQSSSWEGTTFLNAFMNNNNVSERHDNNDPLEPLHRL